MNIKEVPTLVFDSNVVDSISFNTNNGSGEEIVLEFPIIIPFIDLSGSDICSGFLIEFAQKCKDREVFQSITGHDQPDHIIASIEHYNINELTWNEGYYYILLQKSDGSVCLVNAFTNPYFRLLTKDICILCVIDDNDPNSYHQNNDRMQNLYKKMDPYIFRKGSVRIDMFNFGKDIQMQREDVISSILNHNIYKMLDMGYCKENISFLIIYDDISMSKILTTEKAAQKIGMYYKSILLSENGNLAFNVNSIDDSTINISSIKKSKLGEDVIAIM